MSDKPLLEQLVESLKCLPGVGPKSAQRMAFHILQRDRAGGARLAAVLAEAVRSIGHCSYVQKREMCVLHDPANPYLSHPLLPPVPRFASEIPQART